MTGVGNTVSVVTTPPLFDSGFKAVVAYDVSSGSSVTTGTFGPWGISASQLSGYVSSPTGIVLSNTHNHGGPAYELVAFSGGAWSEVLRLPKGSSGVADSPLAVTATSALVGAGGWVKVYGP